MVILINIIHYKHDKWTGIQKITTHVKNYKIKIVQINPMRFEPLDITYLDILNVYRSRILNNYPFVLILFIDRCRTLNKLIVYNVA